MLHGLIPIVSKNTGFNKLSKNAIFLEDYKLTYLDKKITELANMEVSGLELLSQSVYSFSRQTFTNIAFEEEIQNVLQRMISKTNI
jgi:hypothetical protein